MTPALAHSTIFTARRYQLARCMLYDPGHVANARPVATIKTGRVAQPITDAF